MRLKILAIVFCLSVGATVARAQSNEPLEPPKKANARAAANATPFVNTNANFKIPELKPNSLRAPANAANANK